MDEAVLDPELVPLAGGAPVLELSIEVVAVIRSQPSAFASRRSCPERSSAPTTWCRTTLS
jgi:hypothetical protein